MEKICPVCGYDKLEDVPYDSYGYPTYVICSCCGFEFGFHDSHDNKTFEQYRKEWIEKGCKFSYKPEKPKGWNKDLAEVQLKNTVKTNYKPRLLK